MGGEKNKGLFLSNLTTSILGRIKVLCWTTLTFDFFFFKEFFKNYSLYLSTHQRNRTKKSSKSIEFSTKNEKIKVFKRTLI